MKFLSKKIGISFTLCAGMIVQGANESLKGTTFADMCFDAQAKCAKNVSGYVIQTGEKLANKGCLFAVLQEKDSGGSIDVIGTKCNGYVNFCSTPSQHILFQDSLVKVVLKPKYNGAVGDNYTPTDVLIIPLRHYNNTHSLDASNDSHRMLLNHIAAVAEFLAAHLKQSDSYTLQTRNGNKQGVLHLHVHFQSQGILDPVSLKTS